MLILVVSGFLGAGKTTFIQHLTQKSQKDFAVYENEFGQTNMDAQVLKNANASKDLQVWEMTENCVCCTGKSDFLSTLLVIQNSLDPQVLIVEPTGVAKLGNILANIRGLGYDKLKILPPVTIIDARAFMHEKEAYDDIFLDQVKNASVIILSKSEGIEEEERRALEKEVKKVNSRARIVSGDYSRQPVNWWDRLVTETGDELQSEEQDLTGGSSVQTGENSDFSTGKIGSSEAPMETFSLQGVSLPTPVHLMYILDVTAAGVFGQIPRVKGYLPCGKEWIRFDEVDKEWSITGFAPQEESVCTFIGQHINRQAIRRYFDNDHVQMNGQALHKEERRQLMPADPWKKIPVNSSRNNY